MRTTLLLSLCIFLFSNCSDKEEDNPLIGTWQLTEQYIDPGDGSGSFMAVDSDKTLTFSADEKITSNGSLCTINTEVTTEGSEGTYALADSTITLESCTINTLSFRLNSSFLTLNYPCFEGCGQRFEKVTP